MLKHIVFIKFKPGTKAEDIVDIEKGLAGLPNRIPEIKRYEFGRDIARSNRSYDFALLSEFENQDAMKQYQVHPYHFAVLNKINAVCEDIVTVDFI